MFPENTGIITRKCTQTADGLEEKNLKFFVTGATGQLGCDVMRELQNRGYEAVGSSRSSGPREWVQYLMG